MPTAILIGFEYTFNTLSGTIIDLYHAFKWCTSFNCNIHVITDIIKVADPKYLDYIVQKNIVDEGILRFNDRLKSKFIVNNKDNLLGSLERILKYENPDNKLIIYYSGHGVKDSMVMPDKNLLLFIEFRNKILQHINPYTEIFCILDCCNPNGLHLPYKLNNNNTFLLSSSKIHCIKQPFLLITSSDANEKSIALKSGSLFSRFLFRILHEMNQDIKFNHKQIPNNINRNLRRLIGNLSGLIRSMQSGYSQTVSVYSSYIIDPVLWMWIGSNKSYDIVTDISLSTLIIRLSPTKDSTKDSTKGSTKGSTKDIAKNSTKDITKNILKKSSNPYDIIYPE